MKLSPEQIQKLYDFTRQHYVEYYDLQTELVDHLANAIEEQWKENPKLSFEDALQNEFKKFGIFGFSDVVEQRQNALNKKYNKIVWHHFKSFFKIPQIIITILLFVVFYKATTLIKYQQAFIFGAFIILFSIAIFKSIQARKHIKNKTTITGKKWLFEERLYNFGSLIAFFQLPIQMINFATHYNSTEKISTLWMFSLCLLIYLFSIFAYIQFFIIPSKAEDYLKQTYPEYELANKM